jgi:hypothetical protein
VDTPLRDIGFTALLNGNEIKLAMDNPKTSTDYCNPSGSQFLSEIRPLLIVRPVSLDQSTAWVDSISTTTCSAGIPLTNQITQSHRVGNQQIKAGTQVLELQQTEAIHFSGTGAQGQHQLTINGDGEGATKFYIEINSGIPIASEARETITLSITSSGRIRNFVQQVQQNVTLVR